MWCDYVFHKQTLRELSNTHKIGKPSVREYLNSYTPQQKIHSPRHIHLVVDGTYFGERKEQTSWCAVVCRDAFAKENLLWKFTDTETTSIYLQCRRELEQLGYTILSVTGDGFGGIRQAFSGIPYQMCHVHMERLVVKGTTQKPQLEAGQVLLAIAKSLHTTDSKTFNARLKLYIEKYRNFLNEKTINPLTGEQYWTHEPLRMALRSLLHFQEYLFTFEKDKNINRTTNSLEGHFSHIEDVINVHRGLSREHKEKILNSIFLASTIAPDEDKLDEIL